MKGIERLILAGCTVVGGVILCFGAPLQLNQLGMLPLAPKVAVVSGAASDSFVVVTANDSTVHRGVLSKAAFWDASGETVRRANFSAVVQPGVYSVVCGGNVPPRTFTVAPKITTPLVKAALKSYYYNRCSYTLKKEFAGIYARQSGHPDTAVLIHVSAADSVRPAGTVIASPGGWYDAGDYNKYSVNSAVSMALLFTAYELYASYFDTLRCDIPESRNRIPDILDEILFNLRWQLTMQDPHDGGVYHKLTTAEFCGMVMPHADRAPRYVVYKSTAAALDFAAVCAKAYRVFGRFEGVLPDFADSCLTASKRAWKWAEEHPRCYYTNSITSNPEIRTGEYTDTDATDEKVWAAAELFAATHDSTYVKGVLTDGIPAFTRRIPSWQGVGALPLFSLVLTGDTTQNAALRSVPGVLCGLADSLLEVQKNSPYHVAAGSSDFFWGSNSHIATMGIIFSFAYRITSHEKYRTAAAHQLDYLLGRNPTGYCFVTGFGSKPPHNIHHRVSTADTVDAPVPGFLAGGPNAGRQDKKHCNCYTSEYPARSYVDSTCSYASNEVAINWNAPLVFLSAAVEVMFGK